MNTTPIALDRLRDAKERSAWMWLAICSIPMWIALVVWTITLVGAPLIFIGFFCLGGYVARLFAQAYIKTNGIEVSATQLPEVNQLVEEGCAKLGLARPTVYVLQHNVWNAFANKVAGQRSVVLFSGAVDSLLLKGDLRQLAFVIGHELGHHAAGHLDFKTYWVALGAWVPWLFLWYSRRREFTCDRIGLYCAGDLTTTMRAMTNMAVGSQLAGQVNLAAAIQQWEAHRGEFFVNYRTLYSTHPQLLSRLAALPAAAQELGIPVQAALPEPSALPPVVEDPVRYMPRV